MLTYVVASLLLTSWILPGLATALTPFEYKDLVGPARAALIMLPKTFDGAILLSRAGSIEMGLSHP